MKLFHNNLGLLSFPCLFLILFFSVNFLAFQANASGNETDHLALLKIKESITMDPHEIFNSWNASLHFCNWFGIACGRRHQRVTSIVLEGQNLFGSISPYIGNLSFLRSINLQNNSLHGKIPQEVGRLFRLQYLILGNNTLGGEFPVNLTNCLHLRNISFSWNNIGGKIPALIGSLVKLERLSLSANKLTGEIPASLGNLSLLTSFHAAVNHLQGNIPNEMGQLNHLEWLGIGDNMLSGIITPSLFNISSMKHFYIPENKLNGSLPDNIGLSFPNLQRFGIGTNQFSGSIPNSLANASQLRLVGFDKNNFVGHVPTNLGNLQNLWWLDFSHNKLGSNSTNDLIFLSSLTNCSRLQFLDFGYNKFGGVLPKSITNFSALFSNLYFGGNQITGSIPEDVGNLINLIVLGMEINLLTGVIPSSFGKLRKLQVLSLAGNRLSGHIPNFIGNLTQLFLLAIQQNFFEGSIPPSIQNCQHLNYLDVSRNFLEGKIPQEVLGISSLSLYLDLSWNSFTSNLPAAVGKLRNVNNLDISENSLSGEIPNTIGDCSSLENLYLQGNSFEGPIPPSILSLKGLQHLDLSQNNLTGEIPQELQKLVYLQYLNLSFNKLDGQVPTGGVFGNASSISLIGNDRLCGGIPELHLRSCPARQTKRPSKFHSTNLKIIITCGLLLSLSIAAFLVFFLLRKSRKRPFSATPSIGNLERVSYTQLYQATHGFASESLLGSGGYSSVYKGFLDPGQRPIAIKVLNLQQKSASKTIKAECNAMRNIRHRNLVKIITFCSSLDYKGNDFKALVMEFMENGSLEKWLHPEVDNRSQSRNLNLLQRLNIAIDVASALHYLHDHCERPIIHCDLKPNNVLLDNNMVAHLSDFGLARILSTTNNLSQSKSSMIGLKGTIGYAAPEYGTGSEVSKEGDVYSFGILILEMFSGIKPTNEIFKDGLNLHDFVKAALSEQQLVKIIDPPLISREMGDIQVAIREHNSNEIEEQGEGTYTTGNFNQMGENMEKCLVSILEVGVQCSTESPKERSVMIDVTRKLHLIKDSFLRSY